MGTEQHILTRRRQAMALSAAIAVLPVCAMALLATADWPAIPSLVDLIFRFTERHNAFDRLTGTVRELSS
jgi:hypothetical protein